MRCWSRGARVAPTLLAPTMNTPSPIRAGSPAFPLSQLGFPGGLGAHGGEHFCLSAPILSWMPSSIPPTRTSGILTFLVVPAFLMAGMVIFLFGAWRWRRKLAKANGAAPSLQINVDLSRAHDRRLMAFFIPASAAFLLLTAMGSYHTITLPNRSSFAGSRATRS